MVRPKILVVHTIEPKRWNAGGRAVTGEQFLEKVRAAWLPRPVHGIATAAAGEIDRGFNAGNVFRRYRDGDRAAKRLADDDAGGGIDVWQRLRVLDHRDRLRRARFVDRAVMP